MFDTQQNGWLSQLRELVEEATVLSNDYEVVKESLAGSSAKTDRLLYMFSGGSVRIPENCHAAVLNSMLLEMEERSESIKKMIIELVKKFQGQG